MSRLQKKIVCAWMFSILTICGFSGSGATYYVATNGNDSNTGGTNDPFRWPQKGVDVARAGDKVIVRQGVYNCRVLLSSYSGSIDASGVPSYITLEGESGAIIDAGYDVSASTNGNWTLDTNFTGGSVYKKVMNSITDFTGTIRPQNLFYNDKMILHIKDGTGLTRLNDPQSSSNWFGVEALHASETVGTTVTTYLRFQDNRNPNSAKIYVSGHHELSYRSAAIELNNVDYIKVKGLSLRNCSVGVRLVNGACNNFIEGNEIFGAKEGIFIMGSLTDQEANLCHNNHFRYNKISLNYFVDIDFPTIYQTNTWVWDQFKTFSDNDREAVGLYAAGHGNKVYGNYIYKHWGAIQDWAPADPNGALANKDYCRQLDVFDNVIEHILDDALEPTGGEIDAQWHDNDISYATVALRLKGIENDGGPMYFYRNRMYTPYAAGSNCAGIYFYAATNATLYIYNNSFMTHHGLVMCNPYVAGFPNTWIINNIFSSNRFWSAIADWDTGMDAKFYNNWCGGLFRKNVHWPTTPPSWFGTGNIIADNTMLWTAPPSFTIPSNSPCKDTGYNIAATTWTLGGVTHNALPGMLKFADALDIGAYQYNRYFQASDASVLDANALLAVDLSTSSRWAPGGTDTHLLLDLGEIKTLTSLDIHFKDAASRTYYFDLYTKTTNGNYNLITPTTSNLLGDGYRHYDFTDHQARYILFVGNGSSYSMNPNVNEVRPNF